MKKHGNISGILSEDDRLIDASAKQMVEALTESLENEVKLESEPYEQYVKRVRLNLLKDINSYTQRMIKGHLAILNELKNHDRT